MYLDLSKKSKITTVRKSILKFVKYFKLLRRFKKQTYYGLNYLCTSSIILIYFRSRFFNSVWIGINDLATEGHYEWTDGSTYNYANWNHGEPNDAYRQENCVQMYRNGKWNDNHCQKKLSYVCKAYKGNDYSLCVRSRSVLIGERPTDN